MRRVFLLAVLATVSAGSAQASDLRAGAAAVVINPPTGTPMAGYYSARGSTGILDNLYCKSLVLEQDSVRVALVVCDLISLPRRSITEARRLIEKETGIPGSYVMISATHTHTGPVVARESTRDDLDGGSSDLGRRYTEALPALIAQSVSEALKKVAPVHLQAARTKEEHLSFNRRFFMRDQTVSWNPRKQHPDIVKPAGPIDPEVAFLQIATPKSKPVATYVNFAMHPDTTGGDAISADFPGVLARLLTECQGPDVITIFANGCCGNLNHRNIGWTDVQKGPHEARRIGTVLAGDICDAFPLLQPLKAGGLQVKSTIVALPLAPIRAEEIAHAKDVLKRMRDPKMPFLEKVKAFQVLDVAAREGKPWEVEVQVISLGDQVAWVSLPGEIFVELGLAIKKASPFPYTFIAELANGSIGYIPDRPAYAQGNYEVVSARCAEGSGELLAEAAVRSLKDLYHGVQPSSSSKER